MRPFFPFVWLVAPLAVAAACSSSSSPSKASGGDDEDAGSDSGPMPEAGSDSPQKQKIEHLVLIIQENHTFDSYFGKWCTAATGSNPTCTQGPSCCEAGPGLDPGSQTTPSTLNDAFNAARDPDHLQACELTEIDGGKMDGFVTSSACGSVLNFAYADSTTAQSYWGLAQQSALADRYFQPIVGASSSNNMYLARAQYVFTDNMYEPEAIGSSCSLVGATTQYTDTTIADLLEKAGVTWGWYSEGYAAMSQAVKSGICPTAPSDCTLGIESYPCVYDPGDDPFAYYKDLVDDPAHFKDYSAFATDLAGGTLPAVSYVKAIGYKSEHPGYGDTVLAGVTFVYDAVQAIAASSYAPNTLILLTWDEGGGFFDHVAPPPTSAVDNQPYGTRLPFLAIGPLAGVGTISHVTMEHSSIVKFIEYNWLGQTGQLQGRDATVANIGSLLDPSLGVPAN
jgi:phospholipase C